MYGIDLGTTNSVISIIDSDGKPKVIENKNGGRITPSAVFTKDNKEFIIGENAKKKYGMNPTHTILSIKRLMGTNEKIKIDDVEYSPEEISAKILRKMVDDANEKLGINCNQVVITVPAYFDDSQRSATKKAGEIAGLEVLRIINEPTAAALAYGLDQREPRTICVYDLGGGTFDVSILTIGENICEVNSTAGNTRLGGDDFDELLSKWIIDMFEREYKTSISDNPIAISRIKEAAENAKKQLSEAIDVDITIPFITQNDNGPVNLELNIKRAEFEEMISEKVQETIECVKNAIEDSKIHKDEIAEILLVGGSTRIPFVQKSIEDFFGKTPNRNLNPDEVVSIGAAIQSGIINGTIENVILADVTPLTLSVEVEGGLSEPMIKRNTTIPTTHTETFTTYEDEQTSVIVHITQGERVEASKNRSLGKFILDDIVPAPAGTPKIQVKFDIDVNGILSVSAKDTVTEKEASITIDNNINSEDLNKLLEDGKKYKDEDFNIRQLIEKRNIANKLIYQCEKTIEEYKDKIDGNTLLEFQEAIESTRDNLDVQNPEVINESIKALKQLILQIGEQIYS